MDMCDNNQINCVSPSQPSFLLVHLLFDKLLWNMRKAAKLQCYKGLKYELKQNRRLCGQTEIQAMPFLT